MKKLIYFFGFLFIVFGSQAKLDLERPESKPNHELARLKSVIRTVDDFMGTENLGFQTLTEKNEVFIKSIITDLGMDDYCIEIRGMSNLAQREIGRLNAFVIPSGIFGNKSHSYLYISEDWFDTLSEQEKQALVRHELMHLQKDHVKKKNRFLLASGVSLYFVNWLTQHLRNYSYFPKDRVSSALADRSSNICWITWFMLVLNHSRRCEKEADIEAAKTMQDKQGFIDLFKDFKDGVEDPDSKFKIKRFVHKLFKPLKRLLSTHPEFDERVAYIKELP